MHLTLERLEAPGKGRPGVCVWESTLLEARGRRNGMRNCCRADWEGDNDWTVEKRTIINKNNVNRSWCTVRHLPPISLPVSILTDM